MKKKNVSVSRIIWVVGIFLALILILYLVIIYKVKYEDLSYIIK